MKKIFIAVVSAALLFAGCAASSSDDGNTTANKSAKLSDTTLTADTEITSAQEVRNLNLGGNTLTVKANGVVMSNVTNGIIVIGSEVGDGDFTISDSNVDEIDVQGGGANSIHINGVSVKNLIAKKDNVRVLLEGATKISEAVVSAAKMLFETATDAKAEVEKLTADAKAETIEFKNTTVKAVDVICRDAEEKMRDVLVAVESSISNIVPKKEDGTVREEFIPKIEILEPAEGKKGMRIKVSNWHPDAKELPIFVYHKGKVWTDDLASRIRVDTAFTQDCPDGYSIHEYEWLDAGKEYVIAVASLKKGEIGSGKEIKYASATKDFIPTTGRGEISFLDANGKSCVATLDNNGTFHWVTRPAKYPGNIEEGVYFNYLLFSDGDNWIWAGESNKYLDGLTEEEAYADFTFDLSGFHFDRLVDNTIYGQIKLVDRNGNQIDEIVLKTNEVTWTDDEVRGIKTKFEISRDGIIKWIGTKNLPDVSLPGSFIRYEAVALPLEEQWVYLEETKTYAGGSFVNDAQLYDFDSSKLTTGQFIVIAQYHGENGEYVKELGKSEVLNYSDFALPKRFELSSSGLLKINKILVPEEYLKDDETLIDRDGVYFWYGIVYKKPDGSGDGYSGGNGRKLSHQYVISEFPNETDYKDDNMEVHVYFKHDGIETLLGRLKFKRSELTLPTGN